MSQSPANVSAVIIVYVIPQNPNINTVYIFNAFRGNQNRMPMVN